jgi:hypothetical protein
LIGRDVDRRQAGGLACGERSVECLVIAYEMIGDIGVDRGPKLVGFETLLTRAFPD